MPLARRLELDRAALMEALDVLVQTEGRNLDEWEREAFALGKATLATARANFPDAE